MSDLPYLPLFVRDYRTDTLHLTTEQHGAYLLLLMQAWTLPQCRLPDCDAKLAAWAALPLDRWSVVRPTLEPFFTVRGQWWTHKRLSKEWHFAMERSRTNKERARKGGIAKALKDSGNSPAKSNLQASSKRASRSVIQPNPSQKYISGERLSFPAHGSIAFTEPWCSIIRESAPGKDVDEIAEAFRKWWRTLDNPWDKLGIERSLATFCETHAKGRKAA